MKSLARGLVLFGLIVSACGPSVRGDGVLRIYTSVTQDTVDAVLAGFDSGIEVEVFRAPTGDIAARLATEQRQGGILADVLWLTDPLSIQQYEADGLLEEWRPDNADALPADLVTETFFGTRLLVVVAVQQDGSDAVRSWDDLAASGLADAVVLPDPGFAGSAFGAMGFFALSDRFGFDFYRRLAGHGATQVSSPGDVIAGVAEGRFVAGMTLDGPARRAVANGSPIEIVYPEPGGIAIYSPIAVVVDADRNEARSFVEHVLSVDGQTAVAATGWQPVRPEVAWSEETGPLVFPDWSALFDRQSDLMDEYRSIFPG
jgi:iron(III) transport system substrate-binding protein